MRYLKLTIAYHGAAYVGWQRQKNGVGVQQRLEEAWLAVTGEKKVIVSSGRTDAGVHARRQVCSVATNSHLPAYQLRRALGAMTPMDISVLRVEEAVDGFHAITDSIEKTYCYRIQSGRIVDPLQLASAWFVPYELDVVAMRAGASHLTGRHDFRSFQASGSHPRITTIRTISKIDIRESFHDPFQEIEIWITADGFLYNMVRNIVGTLVRVGRGAEAPDWVADIRDRLDREHRGQTAPPEGLYLDHVVYDPATLRQG